MGTDFSYKGVRFASYEIHWAPDSKSWHMWSSKVKSYDEKPDSQHGGHWYGVSAEPKELKLFCYFEEIAEDQQNYILWLTEPGAIGPLVFDEKPWMSYEARVTKEPEIAKLPAAKGKVSGTITFNMTAYYPFATTTAKSIDDAASFGMTKSELKNGTFMLPLSDMPAEHEVSGVSPATVQFSSSYHNGGNAMAETVIRIAGDVGDGVTIYNQDTGQYCEIINLTKENTTNIGYWLELHSFTGDVFLTNGVEIVKGYNYHRRGYIQLKAGVREEPIYKISYDGLVLSTYNNVFLPHHVGMSVHAGGSWRKITSVSNPRTAGIDSLPAGTGHTGNYIVQLNKLIVTPEADMELTKFEVDYSHTFK